MRISEKNFKKGKTYLVMWKHKNGSYNMVLGKCKELRVGAWGDVHTELRKIKSRVAHWGSKSKTCYITHQNYHFVKVIENPAKGLFEQYKTLFQI